MEQPCSKSRSEALQRAQLGFPTSDVEGSVGLARCCEEHSWHSDARGAVGGRWMGRVAKVHLLWWPLAMYTLEGANWC